jgi:hypothetical protein
MLVTPPQSGGDLLLSEHGPLTMRFGNLSVSMKTKGIDLSRGPIEY